ncbi:MAG: histidinol-phosphate aminotransferase family protein [Bacteroidetes bacterium]|nr:histidinol-phosphate aminotransferase family protein [Bacteroidota bacterium]
MNYISEKGGDPFKGVRLLLCENPLPPLDEAIFAAKKELPNSNFYTEPFSRPLRKLISQQLDVSESMIHINAGSELILRQLFLKYGQQVHLITPTYSLFPEIAGNYTETQMQPEKDFVLNLSSLIIPNGTTLFVIVNPNNPNGSTFNMDLLPELLKKNSDTLFLVDEAFIGITGQSVVRLVSEYNNLIVTRTFSKAHSLAGFRVGYAILPKSIAYEMNSQNDAYPLARPSEAAALATLLNEDKIHKRVKQLKKWTKDLAENLQALGIRTFPTETYFFLADFAPHNAEKIAEALKTKGFLLKALNNPVLGDGFMRVTTSKPENNYRFVKVIKELLSTL